MNWVTKGITMAKHGGFKVVKGKADSLFSRMEDVNDLIDLWNSIKDAIDDEDFKQQDVIEHLYMVIFDKMEILINKAKE
jgi:hypothetical protein